MRPPTRYYLTTAAALLAILLCGYGVGFLVGERLTQNRLGPGGAGAPPQESWEAATLERLTSELELSPEQRTKVEAEIRISADTIEQTRREAAQIYSNELLELHERLLPHLDDAQREEVEESSRSLKIILDERENKEDASGKKEES